MLWDGASVENYVMSDEIEALSLYSPKDVHMQIAGTVR